MKRALLLFNPGATSVSPSVRDVIVRALSSTLDLEVAETKRRHHATHLAEGAVHEGFDLVISLGGDGTLNEVINGMVGSAVPVVPLPGGGTNVFARTMGLPRDPIEATAAILHRIDEGLEPRRIPLGEVNGRAFTVNVGLGFDAAIVEAVERRFRIKRKVGDPFFVYQGLRLFFFGYPRRDPPMRVVEGDSSIEGLHEVVVCNSNPYTYLGSRPFQLCPMAAQERGLDVMGLSSMRAFTVLRAMLRAFGTGSHIKMRAVHSRHDLTSFTVQSSRPVPYQVDGDHVGEDSSFTFRSIPDALAVLA